MEPMLQAAASGKEELFNLGAVGVVLFILMIVVIVFSWVIYNRMAKALDAQARAHITMISQMQADARETSTEMLKKYEELINKYADVAINNTKAMTVLSEGHSNLEHRIEKVESGISGLQKMIAMKN